jgi:hypothetical protein
MTHVLLPTNHPSPHPTLGTLTSSTNIDPPTSLAIQSLINITLWGENDAEKDGRQEKKVNPMLVYVIEEDPMAIEDHSQDVHYMHLSS